MNVGPNFEVVRDREARIPFRGRSVYVSVVEKHGFRPVPSKEAIEREWNTRVRRGKAVLPRPEVRNA